MVLASFKDHLLRIKAAKVVPWVAVQFVLLCLLSVSLFGIFRVILLLTELDRVVLPDDIPTIISALVMGLRFDIVITGYLLIAPFTILSLASLIRLRHAAIRHVVRYAILLSFALAFLVCAIDIPYFNHFYSRFSVSAFQWTDTPDFMIKMIIQEPRYWLAIIPYAAIVTVFIIGVNRIFRSIAGKHDTKLLADIPVTILCILLILLGIRGRTAIKSPIRVGTAYFCNHAFLNQLGLNPNFTLIRSYLDSRKPENTYISLMNDSAAVANVQRHLGITMPDPASPIRRNISFDGEPQHNYNVVLILMESMAAAKMARHGNPDNLTPFLDSIANHGYYFENTYCAGIHTVNGVFSTLCSFPALFRQRPTSESQILKYQGVFTTLKANGYSTAYFTTHDGQFDNIEGFLKVNDCEDLYTSADYPSSKINTALGVTDDYLFEFSIPVLNSLNKKHKPFFATFMTASDHGPYYIPPYFKPHSTVRTKQSVEFADYSLRRFISLASQQPWFDSTIFVFIADHGAPMDGLYDMSLTYNHVPLLFYAPKIIQRPVLISKMAGQIDVFPTIMGLLRIPFLNNTLGIDLFRETRPFIFFSEDDKYGVIDSTWFLIVHDNGDKGLYQYRKGDVTNRYHQFTNVADSMNTYAASNLQTFQYLIRKRRTGD